MDKVEKTRLALQQEATTYVKISQETGLGVPWLKKYAYGEIDDPSWRRLEKLAAYLKVKR